MTTLIKRGRLVEAAKDMFYQQGVTGTTLADIAQRAEIPLGNVYYHFRTKEALIEAVIKAHLQELQSFLKQLDLHDDPRERLLLLVAAGQENQQGLVRFGCPHGSLCQELDKEYSSSASLASQLFQTYLDWTEKQFRSLGKDEQEAKDLAFDLISSLQGTFLLSNSFRSPELLVRKLQRLVTWLHTV